MTTIRARLTLWYTLAFFAALLLVLAVLAWELNRKLSNDLRKALRTEESWITTLFESEFRPLLQIGGEEYAALAIELHEELEERYGLKRQFAVLTLARNGEQAVFSGGLKNIAQLMPANFFERPSGNYNLLVAGHRYRVRLFYRAWGVIAVGVENETIFAVAQEAGEMLLWLVPMGLLLASAGGWLLAKLALRPVAAAAHAAASISLLNLHDRLPAYSGKDEFGALVSTLNHMIARVEQGVIRLQQFTQDAAHELRTPLTILRGELELAYQSEAAQEETRALLQRTLDRVIALGQIVDSLMLLARSDSGGFPLNKKTFRLDTLVREVFEDLKILAEGRPLEVQLQSCEPMEFCGDQLLLQRLLLNLGDNALKFTAQGEVVLSLRLGAGVEFMLRDTGCGIPAEDLPRICDRFYRVDKSRASATGGSGLGLAICQWIVAAHGGELIIRSVVGAGTTVRVQLPIS
ncbi:MAG: ATP-binding protein [candidate division KSB1 bacterium]